MALQRGTTLVEWVLVLASLSAVASNEDAIKKEHCMEGATCTIQCKEPYPVKCADWKLPNSSKADQQKRTKSTKDDKIENSIRYQLHSLEIQNLDWTDQGIYTCGSCNDSTNLTMFGRTETPSEPEIVFTEAYFVVGQKIYITCFADIFFVLEWILPKGSNAHQEGRTRNSRKVLKSVQNQLKLEVFNITESDQGTYQCRKTNPKNLMANHSTQDIQIFGQIGIYMKDVFAKPGDPIQISCQLVGVYFQPVQWFYKPCATAKSTAASALSAFSNCLEWIELTDSTSHSDTELEEGKIDTLEFNTTVPCRVKCQYDDNNEAAAKVYVQEKDRELVAESHPARIFAGNRSTVQCFASKYFFDKSPEINRNGEAVTNGSNEIIIAQDDTDFMYVTTITFVNIAQSDAGIYTCVAIGMPEGKHQEEQTQVTVNEIPKFDEIYDENDFTIQLFESKVLTCNATGFPPPTITWLYNNVTIPFANETTFTIKRANTSDSGTYECIASNVHGFKRLQFQVNVESNNLTRIFAIVVGVVVSTLLVLSLVLFVFYRREHQKRLTLKRTGIYHFVDGKEDEINTDLSIMEQADLLPYDTNYDYRAKDLTLGKLLGTGAFGEVLLGEAKGILKGEKNTTVLVAVKRVKNTASDDDIRSLISELKIMIFLGKHLNVVNLLGVVRENLDRRQLLVITEFCGFGNLRDFLRRHRDRFVDLHIKDRLDYDEVMCPESLDVVDSGIDIRDTSAMLDSPIEKLDIYEHITTTDLVCWSFQVSQGMNYLARQGVLHGDLAARNILLADDNVVKICDFGFSRWLRPEQDYQKETEVPLPFKWMAIESIEDKVFNTSSDIWSFGVLMWEIFSLGAVPYPDFNFSDILTQLRSGYRMASPRYANARLYAIIMECWNTSPSERPRFNVIGDRLAKFLPPELLQNFNDRNAEYIEINIKSCPMLNLTGPISQPNHSAPKAPSKVCRHYAGEEAHPLRKIPSSPTFQ